MQTSPRHRTGQILRLAALIASTLLPLAFAGCQHEARITPAEQAIERNRADLATLTACMSGTFSSEAQAMADPDFRHIVLHMGQIWPERATPETRWLYVEQAMAQLPAKPYRQRIYKLTALGGGVIRSDVYTMAEPLKYVGGASNATMFAALAPESLTLRDGCSITLTRQEVTADQQAAFVGATDSKLCPSELQGATYATSEALITPAGLRTWDRGYDKADQQVWGATKGGYEFARQTPLSPNVLAPNAPAAPLK